mmetsp:Transcript_2860/g.9298  ORF Transcript_2860/g.9298 Transcript_2860/m.9298 type:complete len:436 (+) Transcript_2860:2378-3685(+)
MSSWSAVAGVAGNAHTRSSYSLAAVDCGTAVEFDEPDDDDDEFAANEDSEPPDVPPPDAPDAPSADPPVAPDAATSWSRPLFVPRRGMKDMDRANLRARRPSPCAGGGVFAVDAASEGDEDRPSGSAADVDTISDERAVPLRGKMEMVSVLGRSGAMRASSLSMPSSSSVRRSRACAAAVSEGEARAMVRARPISPTMTILRIFNSLLDLPMMPSSARRNSLSRLSNSSCMESSAWAARASFGFALTKFRICPICPTVTIFCALSSRTRAACCAAPDAASSAAAPAAAPAAPLPGTPCGVPGGPPAPAAPSLTAVPAVGVVVVGADAPGGAIDPSLVKRRAAAPNCGIDVAMCRGIRGPSRRSLGSPGIRWTPTKPTAMPPAFIDRPSTIKARCRMSCAAMDGTHRLAPTSEDGATFGAGGTGGSVARTAAGCRW